MAGWGDAKGARAQEVRALLDQRDYGSMVDINYRDEVRPAPAQIGCRSALQPVRTGSASLPVAALGCAGSWSCSLGAAESSDVAGWSSQCYFVTIL